MSVPYQVHYFGFDFASKRLPSFYAKAINDLEEPDTFLQPESGYAYKALQTAVDTVLSITRPSGAEEEKTPLEYKNNVENINEFCDKVSARLGELL